MQCGETTALRVNKILTLDKTELQLIVMFHFFVYEKYIPQGQVDEEGRG